MIKITKEQFDILQKAALAKHRLHFIHIKKILNNNYYLEGTEDEICELRECCGDYLPLVGFDDNYDINKSGQLLEDLIDKFYDYLESLDD